MKRGGVEIERIDEYRWKVIQTKGMNTFGIIYLSEKMFDEISHEESPRQVANVATLPGIVGPAIAMPDIHWGYGFPIGGVAAFSERDGVVSPGGVGYDINCGVRLLRTNLEYTEIQKNLSLLLRELFSNIPCGVGSKRKDVRLSAKDEREVLLKGAAWAVSQGYGEKKDLERIEAKGCIKEANPDMVSERAKERGRKQLGTLGSGNHFIELGYVSEVYDKSKAEAFGLFKGQLTVLIHTGSRGLGHQVCDDYIKIMQKAGQKYNIDLPDRQLCCAPLNSPEAKQYIGAMSAAANYAFANRQMLTHWVRESFTKVLGMGPEKLGLELIYDLAHNIAKWEYHEVKGKIEKVCVHRKGATRAFGPDNPELPKEYKKIGQPVLIPGDMGRCSYLLTGTKLAMKETFGSTCHGAGRLLSRAAAKRTCKGRNIANELKAQGIIVYAASRRTVVEEAPEAYKDINEVVEVVTKVNISQKVTKIRPIGVIKG